MPASKKYIIAHDTGTGGDKAVLTDLQGRIIHACYAPYGLEYPRPGWAEQDPGALWRAVASTTSKVIREAGMDPAAILGVGISAQMFNVLPVDEGGRPLIKMLSWLDGRSVGQADSIWEEVGAEFMLQHTGNVPTAKDIIPKILWLKEERPDIWARTHKLLDCKEYMLLQLTGQYATDWHGASVYYLFDPHSKTWSEPACKALGIPIELLPPAYPCTQVIGEVSGEAAKQTGLLPGTPVVACAGDVAVAQVGSGATRDGWAHLCIGTATWVGLSSSVFRNDPQRPFWGLNHIDPSKWIIAGEMETGGGALMWFRDTLCQEEIRKAQKAGLGAYQLLSQMAKEVPPGADRLLFLPWLSGERSSALDHYLRAAFIGLSLGHEKAHLARAVMEGVAYHIRWICEALEGLGFQVATLNSIGGGSTSETWTQIISDVTGRRLRVTAHPLEAGAMGAALTVAVGLGIYRDMDSVDELIPFSHTVVPRESVAARYEALYHEYRALYAATATIFRRLHDVP
jgi:xylulokinase